MAGARFAGRSLKRPPLSFSAKVALVILLALSSVAIYSNFSSPVSSRRRSSFGDISVPHTPPPPPIHRKSTATAAPPPPPPPPPSPSPPPIHTKSSSSATNPLPELAGSENTSAIPLPAAAAVAAEEDYKEADHEEQGSGEDEDMEGGVEVNPDEDEEEIGTRRKKKKELGPVFDPRDRYSWKLCKVRSGDNYVPCIDMEGSRIARNQRSRHRERSCPRTAPMCLVSLPLGYQSPVPWPESESKIWYKNVVHPKLSAFIKTQSWMNLSGDYLMFPQGASEFNGGAQHYLDSVEEMVPDIEWGKNVRVVLDIGCRDASFGATLLHKDVITLSLGLMDDETDLIQLALERGFPAVVGNLGTRRVPFPNGVFDAIHSIDCDMPWHSNGGKLLLEMNRILRPGGYFILSSKHGDVDSEAGMSKLTASICWNILAHKTDEVSEVGIKIYQRPASNDIYELRRKNEPPFCKEDENQAVVWYETIKTCLHKVPEAIEQRGTDWPEEWPKRLDTFPEWLGDLQEKLASDNEHWKAIVSKSYLVGMGIDWSNIRNIMDMKAIYGGFAAAMASEKVWVMNVVPVNAPNTLPIIYERGLIGIYHDWCEPFSTYPRSYDLLHADHLFSRLKNRCKQPVTIVVEMDRILRPGGWAIIRDKLLILNPLETILKSLHWEIRMAYGKDKEGILCAQKTGWRPSAT